MDADPAITSTMQQTMNGLTVGHRYQLQFYWAASELQSRTGITNEGVEVQVFNGATSALDWTSASVTTPSQGFTNWVKVNLSFVATNSSETLKFLSKSTSTCLPPMVLIDGVSVTVPEPGTVTMLGAGLAMILVAAVRRRKRP